MRKIAKFFWKLFYRSVLMLIVSGVLVYWLTGLNPAGLMRVSGEAGELVKIRAEMTALQQEFASLDPSDAKDFAKIEALANKQRELQAELMEQLSGEDLQQLKQGGEKLKPLLEKLQAQSEQIRENPNFQRGQREVRSWYKKASETSNEFYEESLKPYLEE